MTKKRMLADVLWDAANSHLLANGNVDSAWAGVFQQSCCAVVQRLHPSWWRDGGYFWAYSNIPALKFLRELGCDPDTGYFEDAYPRSNQDAQRQGARYMWLLLAMHVAEDEGIEL